MSFRSILSEHFRFLFRPLPLLGPEGLCLRILFAILANSMLFGTRFHFDSQDVPTGLARVFDLTFLARPGLMPGLTWAFAGLSVLYALNLGLSVVLPAMTLLHVLVFTFFNSQGFTSHGNQIVSLILLAQTLVVLFFTFHRWIRHRPFPLRKGKTRDSYLLYFSQLTIAGVYMTSVVSKMDESNFQWVQKLPNISVQLVKTHRQGFYSNPEKSDIPRDAPVPAAQWMIENPNTCRLLLGLGLALEAAAFLALANRGWAALIGLSLIAMHAAIGRLMRLYFDLNVFSSWIFLVNIPFWVFWVWDRLDERRHHAGVGGASESRG
jgi:hypothetical protein